MAELMNGLKRTAYCGEVSPAQIGQELVLAGWAARQRDLGNLIFIDLRDRTGLAQLAFDDATTATCSKKRGRAQRIRADGKRRASPPPVRKQGPAHGRSRALCARIENPRAERNASVSISDRVSAREELRLRYRYLDLRRGELQEAILMRHKITKRVRDYFDRHRFVEIETPILIKSTPRAPATILCRRACTPASYTRSRSRPAVQAAFDARGL
jgi:aspartyl-tRNA synthetase